MSQTHQVTVPTLPGQSPMLELHLSVDEITNIIHRHLSRIAGNGHLRVEFRSTRTHQDGRGLITTIYCTKDSP